MKTETEFKVLHRDSHLKTYLFLSFVFKINGSYIPGHNSGPADAGAFGGKTWHVQGRMLVPRDNQRSFRATFSVAFSLCSSSRRRLPTTFLSRPVNIPVVLAKSQLVEREGERVSCNLMYGLLGQLSLLVAKMSLTRYYYAR